MSFVFGANSASTGYNLTRSLRFRASASAYLNRTPSVAGNRKTWTWSGWVKRGTLTGDQAIFFAGTAGNNNTLRFNSDNTMYVFRFDGSITWGLNTTQVFRDPSAWYHVVLAYDSTQATSTNRVKLYINGTQVTAFSSATYPSLNLNSDVNNTVDHRIANNNASNNFDSYQTELNSVDGQALTPSSFGSTNATTGVWQPARYTGTYGTNGFYLPFTDNSALTTSSNVGLGKDFSGNANYWVTNNISITAGVTYDSMTDVPTLTSATASNFAVLNPLDTIGITASNGNLLTTASASGDIQFIRATVQYPSTGKYYFECQYTSSNGGYVGVALSSAQLGYNASPIYYNSLLYRAVNGNKVINSAETAYGSSFTVGDIVGVAVDVSAGTVTFYKNNTSQGAITYSTSGGYAPVVAMYSSTAMAVNFGQRPFSYTPPTGFVALNTFNLPTSTILKGNTVMDATLYTGNGSTQTITNVAGLKPDFVWVKGRSGATDHAWYDSVRGVQKQLESNTTTAETTETTGLTAFGSAGFTVGALAQMNTSAATYVAWQWQAGQGSSSSNTSGSITSTVSVNASAGFSVVTYTGTGVNATVGHGLGVAPSLIIVKQRSISGNWQVYHSTTGNTQSSFLNSTATPSTSALYWNSTSPTSSVFSLGSAGDTNSSGATYVAYCWTPISGFSSIGSYVGNGSNDGVFVYTGFLPKWLLVKNTGQVNDWFVIDSAMNTYNVMGEYLYPSSSVVSNTFSWIDFLSNGFKIRNTGTGNNNSGVVQIYAAFAESPFKNSLAR